ncbi:hypothetical protein [Thauera humireducens]|uniref:hypothetical protein n=1 Tax=Thauera humireducens TaxID=1134435 RepID=UPI00311F49E1
MSGRRWSQRLKRAESVDFVFIGPFFGIFGPSAAVAQVMRTVMAKVQAYAGCSSRHITAVAAMVPVQ